MVKRSIYHRPNHFITLQLDKDTLKKNKQLEKPRNTLPSRGKIERPRNTLTSKVLTNKNDWLANGQQALTKDKQQNTNGHFQLCRL